MLSGITTGAQAMVVPEFEGAPQVKHRTKYIREGRYVAEIDVELIESEESRASYLFFEDACKLDDNRDLLPEGNVRTAAKKAKIYELAPTARPDRWSVSRVSGFSTPASRRTLPRRCSRGWRFTVNSSSPFAPPI